MTSLKKNSDNRYTNIKNSHLIKTTDAVLKAQPGHTLFKWIKGHSRDIGNDGADRLAAAGTQ
jgi:ribonuclease HI